MAKKKCRKCRDEKKVRAALDRPTPAKPSGSIRGAKRAEMRRIKKQKMRQQKEAS